MNKDLPIKSTVHLAKIKLSILQLIRSHKLRYCHFIQMRESTYQTQHSRTKSNNPHHTHAIPKKLNKVLTQFFLNWIQAKPKSRNIGALRHLSKTNGKHSRKITTNEQKLLSQNLINWIRTILSNIHIWYPKSKFSHKKLLR